MTEVAQAYTTISLMREPHVDWITLNRPASLNALNDTMIDELLHPPT